MPHEIVISHASRDAEAAIVICSALERAGHSCFLAVRDTQPGTPTLDTTVSMLKSAELMVVLLSRDAVDAPTVTSEINRALELGLPIFPVRLDQVEFRSFGERMARINWFVADRGLSRDVLDRLVEHVTQLRRSRAGLANEPQPQTAAPGSDSPPISLPPFAPRAVIHTLRDEVSRNQGAALCEQLIQRGVRCEIAPSLGDGGDVQWAANSLSGLNSRVLDAVLISCGREELAGISYIFDESLDPGEQSAAVARAFRTTELLGKRIEFWNAARQSKRFLFVAHTHERDKRYFPRAFAEKELFFVGDSPELDRLASRITEFQRDHVNDWNWEPPAQPRPDSSPAANRAPTPAKSSFASNSIPISALSNFILAPSAQSILNRAKAMTPPGGRFSNLAALAFLFAFKEIGRELGESNTTIQFVHRYIDREAGSAYENVYRTTVEAWSNDSPADIRVEPPPGSWVKTITPNVQRLFLRAQQIAAAVWLDDSNVDPKSDEPARGFSRLPITIHARHLFAALLTFEPAPGSPNNVIEKLNGLKIDIAALRTALFEVIVANTPEENTDAWRKELQVPVPAGTTPNIARVAQPRAPAAPTQPANAPTPSPNAPRPAVNPVLLSSLDRNRYSDSANRIIDRARELSTDVIGAPFLHISAGLLLLAALDIGGRPAESVQSAQFVRGFIQSRDPQRYRRVFTKYTRRNSSTSPPTRVPADSATLYLTGHAQTVITRAFDIAINARRTPTPPTTSDRAHARHLIASLLVPDAEPVDDPPRIDEMLSDLEVTRQMLARQLIEDLELTNVDDNFDVWRRALHLFDDGDDELPARDPQTGAYPPDILGPLDFPRTAKTDSVLATAQLLTQAAPSHHLVTGEKIFLAFAPDAGAIALGKGYESLFVQELVINSHLPVSRTALPNSQIPSPPRQVSTDAYRAVRQAQILADTLTPSSSRSHGSAVALIEPRHLVGALLTYSAGGNGRTSVQNLIAEMGLDLRDVRGRFLNVLRDQKVPEELYRWRAVLGLNEKIDLPEQAQGPESTGERKGDRPTGEKRRPDPNNREPAQNAPDSSSGLELTDQPDLAIQTAEPSLSADPPLSYLSPFDNDQNTVDKLNLEHEIDALAYLIAANTVKPPLAIGLFGEWGSGKSFFMDRLRERVHRVARRARAGDRLHRIQTATGRKITADPAKISFHRHICQIQFNAWHYVEGNIWASLVENIFSNLQAALIDPKAEAEERLRQQNELKKQLGFAQQARADLEAKLITLNAAREKANTVVETARRDHTDNSVALGKAIAKDIWDDVAFSDKDNPGKLRTSLIEAGFPESALDTPRELYDVVHSLRTTGGWFRAQFALIAGARGAGKGLFIFIAASILAIAIALALWAIQTGALAGIIAIITQVTGLIAGLIAWLRTQAKRMADLQRTAEPVFKSIEAKLAAATQARAQLIAMLEKDAEQSNALFLQAKAQLDHVDQEIAKIQAQIKSQAAEPDATKVLAQFIEERAACTDYRRHLGITAIVRRDFEKLAGLIASRSISTTGKDGPRSIDRIVLYIDDLDRCPPDKVVAVLEAIHLILAFKLFVVVVGVDARWVSHSLRDRYGSLLSGRGRTDAAQRPADAAADDASATPAAVPEDYLEKIFQVPFRLRSLTREGTESLIDHLTGYARAKATEPDASQEITPLDQQQTPASPPLSPPTEPGSAAPAEPASNPLIETKPTEAHKPDRPSEVEAGARVSPPDAAESFRSPANIPPALSTTGQAAAAAGSSPAPAPIAASIPPASPPATPVAPPQAPSAPSKSVSAIPSGMVPLFPRQPVIREVKAPNLNPGTLELTDDEIDLMISLAPVIGRSPRAVNRFVNCYRLLKAARDPNDIAAFAAASKNRAVAPPYEASMLLLAIVIGAPEVASPVLSHLARGLGPPKADKDSSAKLDSELKRMLDLWANDRQINAEPDWKTRIKPFFDDYLARKLNAGDPCSIQPLCDAVASVARYSFRTGMMEDIDTLLSSRPKSRKSAPTPTSADPSRRKA